MTLGTLRDQVIYPDTIEDQKRKGITDQVKCIIIPTIYLFESLLYYFYK